MPVAKRSRAPVRLDTDRIAAAAIKIVDKRGLSGFTVRAVAKALGVTPMALYYYVQDKAELAALVVAATLNENPLTTPTGDWQEDLWEMARWMRRGVQAHPAVHELQRAYRIFTPEILRIADRWLSLWQQSGLDLEKAILAATTSSAAIAGLIAEESLAQDRAPPDEAALSLLPNARLLLRATYDPEVTFELGVRAVISGLHIRLTSSSALGVRVKRPLRKPDSRRG